MALEKRLLSCLVITISIVSRISAWNPDIHRYESYDLERGPVIYEAYYPDNNEDRRNNEQEKRYFDREAVLEKTYQVPSQRLIYPQNPVRFNNYQNGDETLLQGARNDRFVSQTNTQPLNIGEISILARRAISRDLENWNTLEQYLDRMKYQESPYPRQIIEPNYRIEQSIRGIDTSLSNTLKQGQNLRKDLYEEIREASSGLPDQIQLQDQRDPTRSLRTRDLANGDPLTSFRLPERIVREPMNIPASKMISMKNSQTIMDPYPTENIFAPRPQIINYIFSRKPDVPEESKAQNTDVVKETEEAIPRSYGDNLIQDEIKKSEEKKDVKVTSIEISEVPRHKTRHHHGEWPKRDYPRHHKSELNEVPEKNGST